MSAPAGPLLALDTSTAAGSVAVGDGARLLTEVTLNVGPGHSSVLLPAIDQAMRWAGLTPADLRGVVVGSGPGSFTGLRVAAATAKGLSHALQIPIWAYSSLLAAAAAVGAVKQPVCALFDARRREVYAACYRLPQSGEPLQTLLQPTALPVDDLLQRLPTPDRILFTGEAALLYAAELRNAGAAVAPARFAAPRASALLWLTQTLPGAVAAPATWEPNYVRASGAERIANARAAIGSG